MPAAARHGEAGQRGAAAARTPEEAEAPSSHREAEAEAAVASAAEAEEAPDFSLRSRKWVRQVEPRPTSGERGARAVWREAGRVPCGGKLAARRVNQSDSTPVPGSVISMLPVQVQLHLESAVSAFMPWMVTMLDPGDQGEVRTGTQG